MFDNVFLQRTLTLADLLSLVFAAPDTSDRLKRCTQRVNVHTSERNVTRRVDTLYISLFAGRERGRGAGAARPGRVGGAHAAGVPGEARHLRRGGIPVPPGVPRTRPRGFPVLLPQGRNLLTTRVSEL